MSVSWEILNMEKEKALIFMEGNNFGEMTS